MGFRVFSSVGPLLIAPFAAAVLATTFSRDTEAQTAAPAPLNAQPLPYAEPPLAHPVPQQMRLSFHDPWTKYCRKEQDANAKQVCFTGIDGQDESGQPVVAAVMIDPDGESKKILRVTLPLGVRLVHGTRVTVDNDPPRQAPYVICFTNGCMSDYEAN